MHRFLRFMVAWVFLAGCCLTAQDLAVTSVQGESWLSHLARDFNQTSMGKTGRLGPPDTLPGYVDSRQGTQPLAVLASQKVTVHGADLYRMNCQGCHGETGGGAPPEINSVINPVRSTSVPLVVARMRTVGMDLNPVTAAEMAQQSRKALLLRLHKGGHDMPPFPHLSDAEIRALMAYLNELAGVPGAQRENPTLQISRVRVGEHVAKSTCHICHSATGSNPNPEQLLEGAIPPLSALPARMNLSEFVRKVTQGAPVLMGAPPLLCRGRMPVFGYLTEDEATDVYLYLTLHPPEAPSIASGVVPGSPVGSHGGPDNGGSRDASDQDNPQPISLARFALFPGLLFLFLGGIVVKCMPLAERFHQGHEISGISRTGVVHRPAIPAPAGRGEDLLPCARQDSSERAAWPVLQPLRPDEK